MRRFYLYDGDDRIGELSVDDRELELVLFDNVPMSSVPIKFHREYPAGIRRFRTDKVMNWICTRVVPHERQNIGSILRYNGLKEYDELQLFLLADGEFNNDGYYIKEIKE